MTDLDPENLLIDLESNYLEVVLCPAPDPRHSGHSIRVVQYANAPWYKKFCAETLEARKIQTAKGKTKEKRKGTIRNLKRLIEIDAAPILAKSDLKPKRTRATSALDRLIKFILCEKRNQKSSKRQSDQIADGPLQTTDGVRIPF